MIVSNRYDDQASGALRQLVRSPTPSVYARFERDARSLIQLMLATDPPPKGGLESDRTVQAVESEVGTGLATVEQDCAQVRLAGSQAAYVDALGVVEATLNLESVLYVRLQAVDEQQPIDAPDLAEQQNQFIDGLRVEAGQFGRFVIDAARDIAIR